MCGPTYREVAMSIERNRHPSGSTSNLVFGLCCIADGLVRVLSLGHLHSTFTLDHTRKAARKSLDRLTGRSK